MRVVFVINLLTLLLQAGCSFSFYQPMLQNVTYYKCIKPTVNDKVVTYFRYFTDFVDPNSLQNMRNA